MKNRAISGFGWLAAAAWLGACAGAATPVGGSFAPSAHAPHVLAAGTRPATGSRVVFTSYLAKSVYYFTADIHAKNPPALGEISQGVTRAQGLFVDRSGTLYVSNDTSPASVVEYERGTSSPSRTITSGLRAPGALVVDASGTLYVADTAQRGGIVQVYPAGQNTPGKTIAIPNQGGNSSIGGVAFDPRGKLLAATFNIERGYGDVYRVAPGSSQPVNLNLIGIPGNALGADKSGNVFVGGAGGEIAVYAPGATTPSRYVNAGKAGFYSDFDVTPNGTIYWPNY
jgi:hypothetical protein